jgi:hypothetical protein
MKMIEFLYYGMLLGALGLIYFAVENYSSTQKLLNNGVRTIATVVDMIEIYDDDDGGTTYKPVFEYVDRQDTVISFKSDVSSRPAAYNIGDTVNIVYSKDNDDRKIISFWGLYRWVLILSSIASPLLIIGTGYLLYSK